MSVNKQNNILYAIYAGIFVGILVFAGLFGYFLRTCTVEEYQKVDQIYNDSQSGLTKQFIYGCLYDNTLIKHEYNQIVNRHNDDLKEIQDSVDHQAKNKVLSHIKTDGLEKNYREINP